MSLWTTLILTHVDQGEQVYSVKWYKGGLEIFRYIPSNNPAMAVFAR